MLSFVGAIVLTGALFFGPVLVALLAAALMLPRALLVWYAACTIAAILIVSSYYDAYEDAALTGIGTFVFEVLAIGTVIVGLLLRWAIGEVRRPE